MMIFRTLWSAIGWWSIYKQTTGWLGIRDDRANKFGSLVLVAIYLIATFYLCFLLGLVLRTLGPGATAYFHSVQLTSDLTDRYWDWAGANDGDEHGLWPVFLFPLIFVAQVAVWTFDVILHHNCLAVDALLVIWLLGFVWPTIRIWRHFFCRSKDDPITNAFWTAEQDQAYAQELAQRRAQKEREAERRREADRGVSNLLQEAFSAQKAERAAAKAEGRPVAYWAR